ncbi:rho termination factor, N-terminal domain protein [Clostridioides difficile CD160]|nr:rho termination factor, N-terminal domain protein [Clostridioides difficile CD160]
MNFYKKRIIESNDFIIEIDDAIADIVIELNKKGYKTMSCCSGHEEMDIVRTYILFREPYDINPPKEYTYKNRCLERYIDKYNSNIKTSLKYNIDILQKWVHGLYSYSNNIEEIKNNISKTENKYNILLKNNSVKTAMKIAEYVSKNLDKLSVKELRNIIKTFGISNYSKLNKKELLSKLIENFNNLNKKDRNEVAYWIYINNKLAFSMYKKEVLSNLNITESKFKKIQIELEKYVIGETKTNINGTWRSYMKYDREQVYNLKLKTYRKY